MTLVVEILLTVLLAATLGYCIVLERRLAALRSGQDGLKTTITDLNAAVAGAGAAMRSLKATASETGQALEERAARARALADELSVLCASGERIAERIARGQPQVVPKGQPLPSNAVMGRLDALRAVR